MAEWVVCPVCGLKHSPRPDGLCPRCKGTLAEGAGQPEEGRVAAKHRTRETAVGIMWILVGGAQLLSGLLLMAFTLFGWALIPGKGEESLSSALATVVGIGALQSVLAILFLTGAIGLLQRMLFARPYLRGLSWVALGLYVVAAAVFATFNPFPALVSFPTGVGEVVKLIIRLAAAWAPPIVTIFLLGSAEEG